jgi:hypothetical protein
MNIRVLLSLCFLIILSRLPALCAEDRLQQSVDLGSQRPLLAVWCKDEGWTYGGKAPYLRIAIWADGRVLFAADPKKWSHDLREGKIAPTRISELKKRIEKTEIFKLKGNAYLVPDGGHYCILADVDSRQQVLYWYGGVSAPRKLRECWDALNQLALDFRPTNGTPVTGRFKGAPDSWYPKKAVNAE